MKKTIACSIAAAICLSSGALLAATLSDTEKLGKHLYQDKDLSYNSTQSCATCHHHSAGFVDPVNTRDPYNSFASTGDDGFSKGGRNAPSSAYCGYSPSLRQDADGNWIGGLFWDGRATGETLGDPLAEQAQGPPLNPVEMGMPDIYTIVARVEESAYNDLFLKVFGNDAFTDAERAYDNIAIAIAAYERSVEISQFNSRYDTNQLKAEERRSLALFTANCSACHSLEKPEEAPGPVFTSYGYANIGVPLNEALLNDPDSVYNPPDLGLGSVVNDPDQDGKFKIPTLRNIAVTAPYSHNGSFPTLRDIVSFHNSREGWPAPEVETNISEQVGNMGLTENEIDEIVMFLHTLTDSGAVN